MYDNVEQDPTIPHRIRNTLRSIAYDRGHAYGEAEVETIYNDMLFLFQPIIDDIKECGEGVDKNISLLKPLVDELCNKEDLSEGASNLICVWDTTQYITSHLTGDLYV